MAKMTFNVNKAIGMAGGIWGTSQLEQQDFYTNLNLDPKLEALGMIFLGDWLPKQRFASKAIKNNEMRGGLGAGMEAMGIIKAMEEFGISGVGMGQLRDDDILVVALDGTDDEDYERDDDISDDDDDLDTVNEDVLADDDDDLDTVNEDVLADDDDDDELDDYM